MLVLTIIVAIAISKHSPKKKELVYYAMCLAQWPSLIRVTLVGQNLQVKDRKIPIKKIKEKKNAKYTSTMTQVKASK